MSRSGILDDPSAHFLRAGDLEALFLPRAGMLGASLRHRGGEMLGRLGNLEIAAAKGSTVGLPFLHPWANRLGNLSYRAAGREVNLDPSSPLLHFDSRGLPMHGVPWSLLAWETIESSRDRIVARLDWNRSELLTVFPFPHRIELVASLRAEGLTVETFLTAGREGRVPVSFGFHPYFTLDGLPRAEWEIELPAMRKLFLDPRGIPTGKAAVVGSVRTRLGVADFDDGFALVDGHPGFSLRGAGRRVTLQLESGYTHAQLFAPKDQDYVAFEPMTAPTSALTSGDGLRLVEPGERFRAAFRIVIDASG
jgi:aldose 1-epimerase